MAAREHTYGESLTRSTTTSTSYQDKLTVTLSSPEANATYAVLAAAKGDMSSVSEVMSIRVYDDTDTTKALEHADNTQDATDAVSLGGLADIHTFGASPSSHSWKLQYHVQVNDTGGIQDAAMAVIKLDDADEAVSSTGASTTTSSTYQDKTTLNFTPASAGDYLIIATCEIWKDSNPSGSRSAMVRLFDGSTGYGDYDSANPFLSHPDDSVDGTARIWSHIEKATNLSGSQTWKIQFGSADNSDTVTIREARILAIRLDALNANYYAAEDTKETTTNTSGVVQTTLTDTTAAEDHLILAAGGMGGPSTAVSTLHRVEEDSTQLDTEAATTEPRVGNSDGYFSTFFMQKNTLTAASHTWDWYLATADSGQAASSIFRRLAVLELTDSAVSNFPVVETTSTGEDSGTTTTVTLPSGIAADDLVIVVFASDGGGDIDWTGTSFTEIFDTSNGTANTLSVGYKKAAGGETSITVGHGNERTAYACYRISGAEDPATQAPEISTGATGSDAAPDPDIVTPTGGAKDYLWIACHGNDANKTTSGYPTGYDDNQLTITSAGGGGATGVAAAAKNENDSSDNPDTFTISGSDTWVAATIAVHPVGVVSPSGAGSQTIPSLSQAATGEQPHEGAGGQVVASVAQAGAGHMHADGAGAQALAPLAQAGAGAQEFLGTGAQLLASLAQVGAATSLFTISGAGAQTLASLAQIGAGAQEFPGTGAQALSPIAQAGAGHMHPSATGSQLLASLAQAGVGAQGHPGTGAQLLASVAQAGVGVQSMPGAGAQVLASIAQAGAGAQEHPGTGSQLLASLAQAGAGAQEHPGTGAQVLPSISQAGSAIHGDATVGTGSQLLASLAQLGTAEMPMAGAGIQALSPLTQSGVGHMRADGAGSQLLASLTQAGVGNGGAAAPVAGATFPMLVNVGTLLGR